MTNSDQTIPCPSCQTKIPFDAHQLVQGFKFACPKCMASIGISNNSQGMVEESMNKFDELRMKSVKAG